MTYRKLLGAKISLPVIILTTIFIVFIIFINNNNFNSYSEKKIKEQVNSKIIEVNNNIERVESKALWIASICSELDVVKKAYNHYYETNDLEEASLIIQSELTTIDTIVQQNFGDASKIHFHLPQGVSFARSWTLKHGDDLSSFRHTVMEMAQTHQPITGIEVGRGGFVIRGIAPIFSDDGTYLGSVESYFPIVDILNSSKIVDNEQFAIFMHTDLLQVATKFDAGFGSNVAKQDLTLGNLIFVTETSEDFILENIDEELLNQGLNNLTEFEVDSFHYAVFPIYAYNGEAQGVGVIQINISNLKSSISFSTRTNIIYGIILILFIIGFVWLFVRYLISKPIYKGVEYLKKISDKEIDFKIKEKRKDEVGELYSSITEISGNFKTIISNIKETSSAVLNASSQLASTAIEMAQNSNEQSATTEQISSSMEEMLATVQSNTQKAEQTGEISNNSAKRIKENNETFIDAINSVFEISNKIAVISDIASKTEILSINAAIEASQAGDLGRGFAVVAQEVRKLADNSREAAKQIGNISLKSQEISKEAGEKLNKIIPEIIKSAELIDNIIVASREQTSSIEAINGAILQLVEITNENSAASEELSASAEELEAQAEQLKEIISIFKL